MHKYLPAGPSNRLLFKYNIVNLVNFETSLGIVPFNRLPDKSSRSNSDSIAS